MDRLQILPIEIGETTRRMMSFAMKIDELQSPAIDFSLSITRIISDVENAYIRTINEDIDIYEYRQVDRRSRKLIPAIGGSDLSSESTSAAETDRGGGRDHGLQILIPSLERENDSDGKDGIICRECPIIVPFGSTYIACSQCLENFHLIYPNHTSFRV